MPKHRLPRCVLVGLLVFACLSWTFAQEDEGAILKMEFQERLQILQQQRESSLLELAPLPLPDNQNAAILYAQAFAQLDLLSDESHQRIAALARKEDPLTPDELQQARLLLKDLAHAIQLLSQGAARPACRFPVDYDKPGSSMKLPHIKAMHAVLLVLHLSSRVSLQADHPDDALRDCLLIFTLGDSVRNEPLFVSLGMRYACDKTASVALQCIFEHTDPPPKSLRRIQALGNTDERSGLVRAMKGERVVRLDTIGEMTTRAWRTGGATYLAVLRDRLRYLEIMDTMVSLSAEPWSQSGPQWNDLWKRIDGLDRQEAPFCSTILPGLRYAPLLFDRHLAARRQSALAATLRVYNKEKGEYPDKLSDLVPRYIERISTDPFTGKEFAYKKVGQGFTLKSGGVAAEPKAGILRPGDTVGEPLIWKCSR